MNKATATAEKTELYEGALPITQPTDNTGPVHAPVAAAMVVTCQQCAAWRPLGRVSPFGQCTSSMKFGSPSPVMRADLDPACSQAILPKY